MSAVKAIRRPRARGPRAVVRRKAAVLAADRGSLAVSGSLRGIAPRARVVADLAVLRREAERRLGRPIRLEVATLSDAEIRRVNRRFLDHDYATDVVSFPLSEAGSPILEGSLAVSADTARREAARRGHAPYHEWMLYVVHGTLHLLGHDDHAPSARRRMREAEREMLAVLGLPPVYGRDRDPRK